MAETAVGIVIRSTGSRHLVQAGERLLDCTLRGKFRLDDDDQTNPVVIGDRVVVETQPDHSGVITEIEQRTNKLTRRAAGRRIGREHVIMANVDAAWVVQSVTKPRFNPGFVDRFLVMAEAFGVEAGLVINKLDLLDEELADRVGFFAGLYESIGYPVIGTSTVSEEGIEDLRAALSGKTCVVVGPSGAGKTSLLNLLNPALNLRTGEVSVRTRKGKHTTTYAELIPLGDETFVGDTPGLREWGLVEIEPEELDGYFVEFREFLNECRFPNCTHDHEPGCRIKELVEEDVLAIERYESYINMLGALRQGDRNVGR
ncbi:MAG: ribosome small subunit-dependent GTPase A [Rhodothermales bacterium]|nr:ribosome small subunit-dependent GTPase A [Rhodothermales bacterium]